MGVAAVPMARFDPSLRESPAPVLDHRRFGLVRASLCRGIEGFLWESLDLVRTQRGPADLEFEAGAWGPGPKHEDQLEAIVASLDDLTEVAAQAIADRFEEWFEDRQDDPLSKLEWQGARLTGRTGSFRLHYWFVGEPDALVTVRFERSKPTAVEMHE